MSNKLKRRIISVDSFFPLAEALGFRHAENRLMMELDPNYKCYFVNMPDKNLNFEENLKGYLSYFPQDKGRILKLPESFNDEVLAFTCFLQTIFSYLPYFEKNKIPFVCLIYPGGGFFKPEKLTKVFNSPCFRKVIVTQKSAYNYLIKENLCSADKIEFLFGGYAQITKDDRQLKLYYKKDKSTIDIMFMAFNYSKYGYDKGFDIFMEVAMKLAAKYDFVNFHILGNWDKKDINFEDRQDENAYDKLNNKQIFFYGTKNAKFVSKLLQIIDIGISPHRATGCNYNGFGLGFDMAMNGAVLMTSDPHDDKADFNNVDYFLEGEEIFVIEPNVDYILDKVEYLINNPNKMYEIGRKGLEKFLKICNPEERAKKTYSILLEEANK